MKDIPRYKDKYAITADGQVWSYPKPLSGALEGKGFTYGKWLKHSNNASGYKVLRLGAEGNIEAVHRLVAETYLDKPEGKNHVNHKDGNKTNNHYSNLEWCTQAENNQHAWRTGLCKPAFALTPEQVIQVRIEAATSTQVELGKKYGVGKSTIGRVVNHIGYD